MDKTELTRFEAQAQIMKALSHPTRLFIVHELAKAEKCVCELTEMVELTPQLFQNICQS